jgi:hypothetical protein
MSETPKSNHQPKSNKTKPKPRHRKSRTGAKRAVSKAISSMTAAPSDPDHPLMDDPTAAFSNMLDGYGKTADTITTVLDITNAAMETIGKAADGVSALGHKFIKKEKPEADVKPEADTEAATAQKPSEPATEPAEETSRPSRAVTEPVTKPAEETSPRAAPKATEQLTAEPTPKPPFPKIFNSSKFVTQRTKPGYRPNRTKVGNAPDSEAAAAHRSEEDSQVPPEQNSNTTRAGAIFAHGSRILAKGAYVTSRAAVEQSAKAVTRGALSVSDEDAQAALTPGISAVELGVGVLRPKSLAKSAYTAAGNNVKGTAPGEIQEAYAPGIKALSTAKTTGKATAKTAKTAKTTVKTAKRAARTTVVVAKAAIKAIKLAKIAVALVKVAIKAVKIVAKAVVVAVKAVKAAVAALVAVKAAVVIAVIAAIAIIVTVLMNLFSNFTPNTEEEVIADYINFVMEMDDAVNEYIAERLDKLDEGDEYVFLYLEELHTDLIKFFAIFIFWQDNGWDDMWEEMALLHSLSFTLEIEEEIFYTLETFIGIGIGIGVGIGIGIGIDEDGYEYEYEYEYFYEYEYEYEYEDYVQRLRLIISLIVLSVAEIAELLEIDLADVEWIYTIMENLELPGIPMP